MTLQHDLAEGAPEPRPGTSNGRIGRAATGEWMTQEDKIYTACMIVIGDEILSGRTRDANLAWIAVQLNEIGVRLREARVIPDVEATIVDTVNEARGRFDYVFTSGGIGPTHDDITADAIAKAFGVAIEVHPEAVARMQARFGFGEMTPARLRMARIPAGASLIDNPVSQAPGFRIENVFVMAGIPAIMQAMFNGFRDQLVGGLPLRSRTIGAFVTEGQIAAALGQLQEKYADVAIGSYPFQREGRYGTSIVIRGTDLTRLGAAAADYIALVRNLGAEVLEDIVN